MANKKKGVNTGKKVLVLRDVLKIAKTKSGGCYALMPYETVDRKGKAIFKIGMSTSSMNKRMDTYHTYFPEGVYYSAFLIDPPVQTLQTRTMKKIPKTKTEKYLEIEKFIIDFVLKQPGTQRVFSTTRVRNANDALSGQTEWVYCNEEDIHKAFVAAQEKFGGKVHLFYLEGLNPETGAFESINDNAKEKAKGSPLYTGKVIFKS